MKTFKLLKVANPHAEQNWKGRWSDNDENWDDRYRNIADFENKRHGEFFIDIDDFLKYFEHSSIYSPIPDREKISKRYSHPKDSYLLLKFTTRKNSKITISVSQYYK